MTTWPCAPFSAASSLIQQCQRSGGGLRQFLGTRSLRSGVGVFPLRLQQRATRLLHGGIESVAFDAVKDIALL